jgi:hypothetical protein
MRNALLTGLALAAPRRGMSRRRGALGAFAIYLAVSFLAFGLRLLIEPGSQYIGSYDDPQITIWAFAWWPHALLQGQNPFVTHAVWPPVGVNLAWATSVPALSLAFAPLTLIAGAIASYNVAMVLLPALSAWAAFLLCRHLTAKWWPSLVGGYLFGFSSYILGHTTGHPQLTAAFVVPLLALVVLQHLEGTMTGRRLAVCSGLLFALQILLSTEMAFTLALVVVGTLIVGYLLAPTRQARVAAAVLPLVGGCVIAALLSAPFLYYALTAVRVSGFQRPSDFVADLLNLVVPNHVEAAGTGFVSHLSRRFPGNYTEQGAFIGLPALVIVVLFARRRWRTAAGRFLIAALVLTVLASLGPELTVGGHRVAPIPTPLGHETVTLPGVGTKFLPLFDNALPVRFALYTSLAVAMIVALWMASRPRRDVWVWLLPAVAVLLLVPNPSAGFWSTTYVLPPFFSDAAYRTCLGPNEIVLPQPIRGGGPSLLWQVADDFRFRIDGGRLQTSAPSSFLHPASIAEISIGNTPQRDRPQLLRAFFRAKGVTAVVVDKRAAAVWAPSLDRVARRHDVGGVLLYRVGGTPRPCPES